MEEDAKQKDRVEKDIQNQVEKMNQQHASIAQGLMAMVVASLKDYQAIIKKNGKLKLTPQELTNVFRVAQIGERLARGQATSRIEVWLDIAQTVVREFALIFLSVNEIPDPVRRKAEFVRLSDEMITRYFSETTKQAIELGPGNGYKVR